MDRNTRLQDVGGSAEQLAHPSRRPSSDRIFATIRLVNDAGVESMNHLGRNYYNLSYRNRKRLNIGRTEAEKLPPIEGIKDIVRKQRGVKPASTSANQVYNGQWDLEYDAEPTDQSQLLYVTLGIGYDDRPDRGVDILVTYPGKPTHGVLPIHAIIRGHLRSGLLMLEGFGDDVPVTYMEQNRVVALRKGVYRCLWETDNRFFLKDLEVILTYAELSQAKLDELRRLRDTQIYLRDLPTIHPELPLIPPKTPLKRYGDIIVFKTLGSGSFGVVGLGLNIKTGEPCAIKTVWLRRGESRNALFKEAELSFRYPGKPGVIQASRMFCECGNSFETGQPGGIKAAFSSCRKGIDVFHLVLSLGLHDFTHLHLDTYNIDSLVKILKGPAEGIELMHEDPHAHRDVHRGNLIVLAENCGALSDFGKAEAGVSHKSNHIGPACTLAPEIDGRTAYGNKVDVWSYGVATLNVIFKDVQKWKTFNREAPQSKAWTAEAHKKLEKFIKDHGYSSMHSGIAQVIKMMLTYDAKQRPSMREILDRWPGNQDRGADIEDQGPPKKRMKTSESTKKTTKPSSVEKTSRRQNRDGGVIPLKNHNKAVEMLEKDAVQDRKNSNVERQSMGFTAINAPEQTLHLPTVEEATTEIQATDNSIIDEIPPKGLGAGGRFDDQSANTNVDRKTEVECREPPCSQDGEIKVE